MAWWEGSCRDLAVDRAWGKRTCGDRVILQGTVRRLYVGIQPWVGHGGKAPCKNAGLAQGGDVSYRDGAVGIA